MTPLVLAGAKKRTYPIKFKNPVTGKIEQMELAEKPTPASVSKALAGIAEATQQKLATDSDYLLNAALGVKPPQPPKASPKKPATNIVQIVKDQDAREAKVRADQKAEQARLNESARVNVAIREGEFYQSVQNVGMVPPAFYGDRAFIEDTGIEGVPLPNEGRRDLGAAKSGLSGALRGAWNIVEGASNLAGGSIGQTMEGLGARERQEIERELGKVAVDSVFNVLAGGSVGGVKGLAGRRALSGGLLADVALPAAVIRGFGLSDADVALDGLAPGVLKLIGKLGAPLVDLFKAEPLQADRFIDEIDGLSFARAEDHKKLKEVFGRYGMDSEFESLVRVARGKEGKALAAQLMQDAPEAASMRRWDETGRAEFDVNRAILGDQPQLSEIDRAILGPELSTGPAGIVNREAAVVDELGRDAAPSTSTAAGEGPAAQTSETLRGSPSEVAPQVDAQTAARTRKTVASEIELVKQARAERAKQARPGGKRSGAVNLDGEDLADAVKLGKLYVEYGYRTFDEWAKKVIEDLGPVSRRQLKEIFKQAHGEAGDPVSRLAREIKAAEPLRSRKNIAMAEERHRRAGALAGVQEKGAAYAQIGRQLGTQRGQLAEPFFEGVRNKFTDEEILDLRERIFDTLERPYDRLNADTALENLLDGRIPTDSELALLQRVFGMDFVKAVTGKQDSFVDLVIGLRRAGMLSGIRTALRNVGGNVGSLLTDELAQYPAVLLDVVASRFTGSRTRTLTPGASVSAFKSAVTKGLKESIETVKRGELPGDLSKYDFPRELNFQAPVKGFNVAGPLNGYVNFVMRLQGAYDKPARAYAVKRSLVDQAGAIAKNEKLRGADFRDRVQELVKNPTEEMQLQAIVEAEEAVFANANELADLISNAKRSSKGAKVVGDALIPFVKVPTNIVGRVLESTPGGFIFNTTNAIKLLREKGMTPEIQRSITLQLGRGLIGSAAMLMGYHAAKQGWMTPRFSLSDNDTDQAIGRTPSSVKIGDVYYRAGDTPFGMLMAMGAAMYESQQNLEEKGKPSNLGTMFMAGAEETLKSATEMPMVQGVKDLLDTSESLGKRGQQMGTSYAGSFVPAFLGDITAFIDPTVRSAKNPWDAIRARTPGASQGVPAKRTALGQTIQREQIWNPVFGSRSKTADPVVHLVATHGVRLSMPKRQEGESERAFQERAKLYGETVYDAIQKQLVGNRAFLALPKAERAERLKKVIRDSKAALTRRLKDDE